VHQDRVEVLVGEDGVVVEHAASLQFGRRLRDQHAGRQVLEYHRMADHRPRSPQRAGQPTAPAGTRRIGHDRTDLVASPDRQA
jgi:hypothetical protein